MPGVYRLLEMVQEVCLGHALVAGARRIGFRWDPAMPGWQRQGLPGLSNLAGHIQHIRSAFFGLERQGFC